MRIHCLENVDKSLTFLNEQRVHLENMGAHDIVDGNPRLTLGLIWTIILRFQVSPWLQYYCCLTLDVVPFFPQRFLSSLEFWTSTHGPECDFSWCSALFYPEVLFKLGTISVYTSSLYSCLCLTSTHVLHCGFCCSGLFHRVGNPISVYTSSLHSCLRFTSTQSPEWDICFEIVHNLAIIVFLSV